MLKIDISKPQPNCVFVRCDLHVLWLYVLPRFAQALDNDVPQMGFILLIIFARRNQNIIGVFFNSFCANAFSYFSVPAILEEVQKIEQASINHYKRTSVFFSLV